MICLATPRLLLRTWRPEDRVELDALLDGSVPSLGILGAEHLGGASTALAAMEGFDQAWSAHDHGLFAVEDLDGGQLLGIAGLLAGNRPDAPLELVWQIDASAGEQTAEAAVVEALTAVIDWAFGMLDPSAIEASIALDDDSGCRVSEAAGLALSSRTIDPLDGSWNNLFIITLATWNADLL